jgi:hypothetical protein
MMMTFARFSQLASMALIINSGLIATAVGQGPAGIGSVNTSDYNLNELAYKQAAGVYGYTYSQRVSLNAMKEQYPQFASELTRLEVLFDAQYAWPQARAEAVLDTMGVGILQKLRNEFLKPHESEWARQYSSEEVTDFSKEMKRRIKGDITSPGILSNMLWLRYATRPINEMVDGNERKFESAGEPKAQGVDFSLRIPSSWKEEDGDRPHVVRMWTSQNGSGDMTIIALVVKNEELRGITKYDLDALYAADAGRSFVPTGGTLLTSKVVTIDAAPALLLDFSTEQENLGASVSMRIRSYQLFVDDAIVQLQCAVGRAADDRDTVKDRFISVSELCDRVASTLVIAKHWR